MLSWAKLTDNIQLLAICEYFINIFLFRIKQTSILAIVWKCLWMNTDNIIGFISRLEISSSGKHGDKAAFRAFLHGQFSPHTTINERIRTHYVLKKKKKQQKKNLLFHVSIITESKFIMFYFLFGLRSKHNLYWRIS